MRANNGQCVRVLKLGSQCAKRKRNRMRVSIGGEKRLASVQTKENQPAAVWAVGDHHSSGRRPLWRNFVARQLVPPAHLAASKPAARWLDSDPRPHANIDVNGHWRAD